MQYSDGVVINPKMKYDKPLMVGGAKFNDTSYPFNSGKYQKVKAQYNDLQYNSGNQSNQSQIDEFMKRKNKMSGGAMQNKDNVSSIAIQPRKFYATYDNDYLYQK